MNITHIEHQLEHQVKVPTPNYMDISLMYGNESGRNADVYSLADVDLLFANIELDIYIDLGVVNIILIVLYSAIFIVGLLGNIFVIVAIIKFKSLRTLTNYFLLNLTVGDILVILVCIPVTLGSTVYKKWIYGQVLCKLTPFCQGTAQRRRTVKMLICIVVIFGLCWLPYYIVYFWIDANLSIGADNGILTNVYPFVMLLGLSNSAVNPICYCILSRGFRRGFDSILCVNFLRRGGSFLRSSFKMKSTASGSIDTAEV
ncbi:orexin/Hypocretin receptor type 1-like [Dreissena polymorpha]|uniref:orexin/Hypocretin receptor type 1-like n=1 Tax=Dreissena polymorpha TaxID=45954 RepID=UPI002263E173|nr:orexin/Hypocretin receptor type 1-like [Dreissena polymorpha]